MYEKYGLRVVSAECAFDDSWGKYMVGIYIKDVLEDIKEAVLEDDC